MQCVGSLNRFQSLCRELQEICVSERQLGHGTRLPRFVGASKLDIAKKELPIQVSQGRERRRWRPEHSGLATFSAVKCQDISIYWKAAEESVKEVLVVPWCSLLHITGVVEIWDVLDDLKGGCNAVSKSAVRRAGSKWEI